VSIEREPILSTPLDRRGLLAATAAFVIWGLMPLYWHLLKSVPSLQIIAHRILWSAVLVAGWLYWRQGRGWLRATLHHPRAAGMLALSGMFIAFNWGLYIWAVNAGHVVETSLGYFINPLLNVVLGVALLGERLNRVQWLSVAIAAAGVLWLTFNYGSFPWIAIALACSFGVYGLIRKIVAVPPVQGLGVESLYLVLPAVAFLLWSEINGQGGFATAQSARGWGMTVAGLLVFGGALTAVPLIAFADAVQRPVLDGRPHAIHRADPATALWRQRTHDRIRPTDCPGDLRRGRTAALATADECAGELIAAVSCPAARHRSMLSLPKPVASLRLTGIRSAGCITRNACADPARGGSRRRTARRTAPSGRG
jgi:chloramphenicol-sensitive protein RarD